MIGGSAVTNFLDFFWDSNSSADIKIKSLRNFCARYVLLEISMIHFSIYRLEENVVISKIVAIVLSLLLLHEILQNFM